MNRSFFFAAFSILLALAARAKPAGAGAGLSFEGLKASTLASATPQPLDHCPTSQCLTIYVAPWCPYCRASTPMILALRDYLARKGVTTRIVVGLDKMARVRDYAQVFGRDTFLDPEGRISPPGGVPNFIVSDARGRVLRTQGGVPEAKPPFSDAALGRVAAMYGLP